LIHIRRHRKLPKPLSTKGKAERAKLCRQYSADADGFRNGRRRFRFLRTIYASRAVKQALFEAQHGKCAFCESKLTATSFGDVEHFRPKGAVRQEEDGEKLLPGYYWLAYQWGNLFLSCQLCNQRFKRELFPLTDPSHRARCHTDAVAAETPLLIDPAREKRPEALVSFRGEWAFPVGNDARASATINCLGLNRAGLLEQRLQRYRYLLALQEIIVAARRYPADGELTAQAAIAERRLLAARRDRAEYAGMARANFGGG